MGSASYTVGIGRFAAMGAVALLVGSKMNWVGNKRRLFAGIAVYVILLAISRLLLKDEGLADSVWRIPVALLPLPAGAYFIYLEVRRYQNLDEYWQRVHLTALAIAFLGSALVAFTFGFLENAGMAKQSGFIYFLVMITLYVLGLVIARRRYS